MIIAFIKEKLHFKDMLNGERVICTVENVQNDVAFLKITPETRPESRGFVEEFYNNLKFDSVKNAVQAANLLKSFFLTKGFADTDFSVLGELNWRTEFGDNVPTPRNIRVSIPDASLVDTYAPLNIALRAEWDSLGIASADYPFTDANGVRLVYLEEIAPEVLGMLQADENVLVEFNNA